MFAGWQSMHWSWVSGHFKDRIPQSPFPGVCTDSCLRLRMRVSERLRLLESNSEQWASDQGERQSSCPVWPAPPQIPNLHLPSPSAAHPTSLTRWDTGPGVVWLLCWNDWRLVRVVWVCGPVLVCSSWEKCKEVLQHKLKENLTKSPRLFFYWLNLLDQLARGAVCVENFGIFKQGSKRTF